MFLYLIRNDEQVESTQSTDDLEMEALKRDPGILLQYYYLSTLRKKLSYMAAKFYRKCK